MISGKPAGARPPTGHDLRYRGDARPRHRPDRCCRWTVRVLTYAVGRRRREIGIRSALGASRGQIRALVVRDGLVVVALGVPLGCGAGWLLARGLSSLQYGVTATDQMTWTIVIATLVATSVAAAWRPARAASKIDPLVLLREE